MCRGTDATTVNFLSFPQHKNAVVHVLNGVPCILYGELGINLVDFITQIGMECATFGTWYPVQRIFTDSNDLHNEETMKKISQGTVITYEDLENDPETIRTKKLSTFDDADLLNTYCRA